MTENEAIEVLRRLVLCGLCTTGPCEDCERKQAKDAALSALEEIQQYRAIGTVEECRAAMEKQRAKKPGKRADRYTDLIQHYSCPVCGKYFGQAGVHSAILFDKLKYCTCGQAIDWGETV